MAARVIVVVVAAGVLGWLGVMERSHRLQSAGVDAAAARELDRAEDDLRRAAALTPDSEPDLSLAFVFGGRGERRRAAEQVEAVLRREPENIDAWGLLYQLTVDDDPATAERALAARRRLDPLSARPR